MTPPDAPEWLSSEALAHWDRIIGELREAGRRVDLDPSLFAIYCCQLSEWQQANRDVARNGMHSIDDHGQTRRSSALIAERTLERSIRDFSAALGLTGASARSAPPIIEQDARTMQEFLGGPAPKSRPRNVG